MARRFKIYLMGYDPPEVDLDTLGEAWIEARIAECDWCFTETSRSFVPVVGGVLHENYDFREQRSIPVAKRRNFRIVGIEHFGKVLEVEELVS